MKIKIAIILAIIMILTSTTSIYAGPFAYSEETKRLMREASMDPEPAEWEEINRRQLERRNRMNSIKRASMAGKSTKSESKQNVGSRSKNSYDEFHMAPVDIPANDNYHHSGGIDELHINENYKQDIWHPESRGGRINGIDEFRFPDEM